ncbi:MAG TPA: RecQ family ATP-dependent DNA helicase, partial [Candidatus Hydrogenedentes bacterium]|nr:RecQ family ATP-dependent DNA helicase [Candidatus Hydrogenedentota bacterium]
MAALRGDCIDKPFLFSGSHLPDALRELDSFAEGSEFLVGHNIIAFDIPHLQAAAPGLRLLDLPVIDTLRLSPLAFPRNPYHKLVKHYKDGGLLRFNANDPELDVRICLALFQDETKAFRHLTEENSGLLTAFHWLTGSCPEENGFDHFFHMVRKTTLPTDEEGCTAVAACLAPSACVNHSKGVLEQPSLRGWPMAYALAWLSVAGGNSVIPPWVRHEFPEAPRLVKRLRDTRCEDPLCDWCQEHHNSKRVLKHWFGFSDFRPVPLCRDGTPMQE